MNNPESLPPSYFDRLYAESHDPWRFATSDYERRKYQATLDALPSAKFAAAFEVGCSIGVLTRQLADRCDRLLAVDVADAALAQARHRCAGLDWVDLRKMRVPDEWPAGQFDLIVLSEVIYYLSAGAIARCAELARGSLLKGGTVLLVHYTLPTNYPYSGDAASDMFIARAGLPVMQQQREAEYRLDVLRG